ncbi:iron-containing alcohol dehydrogenase [Desulfovermiculus halophilus]|jgi:alcohol dehydrogenase class IV|uniref:iron-containing alcohol dehydrogenase n=1 Tax=Desulfovermiculus halophilus TaxID=339722 RepID=UPI0004866659|nr:iron-containing alcohol dehydrogenase [Desulfovermiculus halophilus]
MSHSTVFRTTKENIIGPGSIQSLGERILARGCRKPCIVTDPGLVQSGIVEQIEKLLLSSGLESIRFDQVEADPKYEIVNKVTAFLEENNADLVVGLGGGSSLDIAKISAAMVSNQGSVEDYFGIDLLARKGLDLILVPTTAGTGSEVTPIVILSDEKNKLKKGIVSSHLFPDLAILDPELTVGLPPHVTAATGMDALIHAVEAYTSVHATPMTDMFAKQAIELISNNLRTAFANGSNLQARNRMLEGSMLAGVAFANAGVTAVHAFAYPIGAEFHIPHGVANTIMLIPVMDFNIVGNLDKFAHLAEYLGQNTEGLNKRQAASSAVQAIRELAEDLQVPSRLRDFGVQESDVPGLAEGVMQVTRLLANNPRTMQLQDAEEIYRKAL